MLRQVVEGLQPLAAERGVVVAFEPPAGGITVAGDRDELVLARSPQFNQTPTDPNAPILPDLDIDVDRMRLDRFLLAKPVIGQKREIAIDSVVHTADGRAQLSANAVVDSGD